MKRLPLILLSCLALSACVTQDQADVKMAKGCAAGIDSLIEPKKIKEIKAQRFANEQAEGGLHRRITLEILEEDGWMELDQEYSCLFMQEWGLFKSSHRALIVQVKIDDQIYGKKDGQIIGGIDDFLALANVVDIAMGQ